MSPNYFGDFEVHILTSFVQDPEFDGWKKLSVEAIILASESSALEPPT